MQVNGVLVASCCKALRVGIRYFGLKETHYHWPFTNAKKERHGLKEKAVKRRKEKE